MYASFSGFITCAETGAAYLTGSAGTEDLDSRQLGPSGMVLCSVATNQPSLIVSKALKLNAILALFSLLGKLAGEKLLGSSQGRSKSSFTPELRLYRHALRYVARGSYLTSWMNQSKSLSPRSEGLCLG